VRLAVESGAARALPLMEAVLRGDGSLAAEFPLVFGPGAPGSAVVAEVAGAVRSACAILVRDLELPGLVLRAGLIGSVATDPEFRGRGLASAVLERAEVELAAEGCLFALLWADEPAFYEARGWRPAAAELDWVLAADLCERLPAPGGVRRARPEDAAAIHALYERHPVRARRTANETRLLLAAPGMDVRVRERAGRLSAYACVGRGADLAGVLHEWGGAADDVLACARAQLAGRERLILMAPALRGELGARLSELGAPCRLGVLGMAKLLSAERAAELLRSSAPELTVEPGPCGDLVLCSAAGRLELDAAAALELLFAPRAERGRVERVEQRLGLSLPALPLAPFVWGLDSI